MSRTTASKSVDADSIPVRILTEGDVLYAEMLAAITSARSQIRLESYLFASDEVGWRFANALGQQARRGVEVRLHLDAAGAWGRTSEAMLEDLHAAGVQIKWFHRWNWREPLRYNYRNHRKLLVVDTTVAYVGGFNIHRESSAEIFGQRRWRDTHAVLQGALASTAATLFDNAWSRQRFRPKLSTAIGEVELLANRRRSERRRLRRLYADRFRHATQRIYVTTPYFVPDPMILRQLRKAARRGVDVRLLVPSSSDVPIARWAAQSFYDKLITSGVKIFEYLPRMLHAKTVVIDGCWSTLGTANMDYRSLHLNDELVLVTTDHEVCATLERQFLEDIEQSRRVNADVWSRRSRPQRWLEQIGYSLREWL